jgi:hypothetical protein
MRKLFIVLFVTTVFSQNPDFRKVNFGDSVDSVKNKETMEFLLADDNPEIPNGYQMIYQGKVAGDDTLLLYNFYKGKLYEAVYMFKNEHKSNRNAFIDDYSDIKKIMVKKYGQGSYPYGKEYYWSNDLYQDDYEDWGMALAIGHLRIMTLYTYTANSGNNIEVRHGVNGGNYKVSHGLLYTDLELSEAANSAKETSTLDDF